MLDFLSLSLIVIILQQDSSASAMAEFFTLSRRRRIPDSGTVLHRRGVDWRRLRDVVPFVFFY